LVKRIADPDGCYHLAFSLNKVRGSYQLTTVAKMAITASQVAISDSGTCDGKEGEIEAGVHICRHVAEDLTCQAAELEAMT
jgi:hypothetical protein